MSNVIQKDQRVTVTRQDLANLNEAVNKVCTSNPQYPISLQEITNKIKANNLRLTSTNWMYPSDDVPFILTPAHFSSNFTITDTLLPSTEIDSLGDPIEIGFNKVDVNLVISDIAIKTYTGEDKLTINRVDNTNSTTIQFADNDYFGADTVELTVALEESAFLLTTPSAEIIPSENTVGLSKVTVTANTTNFDTNKFFTPSSIEQIVVPTENFVGFNSVTIPVTATFCDDTDGILAVKIDNTINNIPNALEINSTSSYANIQAEPTNLIYTVPENQLGYREVNIKTPGTYRAIIKQQVPIIEYDANLLESDSNNLVIVSTDSNYALNQIEIAPVFATTIEVTAEELIEAINSNKTDLTIVSDNLNAPVLKSVKISLPILTDKEATLTQAQLYLLQAQSLNTETKLSSIIDDIKFSCVANINNETDPYANVIASRTDDSFIGCFKTTDRNVLGFRFAGNLLLPSESNKQYHASIFFYGFDDEDIDANEDWKFLFKYTPNIPLLKNTNQLNTKLPIIIEFRPEYFINLELDTENIIEENDVSMVKLKPANTKVDEVSPSKNVINIVQNNNEFDVISNGITIVDENNIEWQTYIASDTVLVNTAINSINKNLLSYTAKLLLTESILVTPGTYVDINKTLEVKLTNTDITITSDETPITYTYTFDLENNQVILIQDDTVTSHRIIVDTNAQPVTLLYNDVTYTLEILEGTQI